MQVKLSELYISMACAAFGWLLVSCFTGFDAVDLGFCFGLFMSAICAYFKAE
jgi:hypothetical protein